VLRDASLNPHVIEVDDETLKRWPLPLPDPSGGKEQRGRVLIIAGSKQIPGAAILAANAALRAGAGKVSIATPESIAQSMAFAVPESRVFAMKETGAGGIAADALDPLDELTDRTQAVLIGPGLPYDEATRDLTIVLLEKFSEAAIVLDAGAMSVVETEIRFAGSVLLTPHAGEMASLTRGVKDAVLADAQAAALEAARAWRAVVALKGAVTWIAAPNARVWRHEGGNAGLGISGSGDVLSGMIAGFAARGAPLEQASVWSVALHARAGDKLAQRFGLLGYLAREIPDEVPALMAGLMARQR
jgi:ADP-dependent NAD(P)H-hydrate dehydratase